MQKPIRGWHAFVRARSERGKTLRELALEWVLLPAEEKGNFYFDVDEQEDIADAYASTPWCIGDKSYPMSEEAIGCAAEDLIASTTSNDT